MIALYVFIIGICLIIVSLLEVLFPLRAFHMWTRYISSKLFFAHGILLITGGFPLVIYKGGLSIIIFIVGVIVILTGPFIIIYPEKIRQMFISMGQELDQKGIRKLVYFDASVRFIVGMMFTISYLI